MADSETAKTEPSSQKDGPNDVSHEAFQSQANDLGELSSEAEDEHEEQKAAPSVNALCPDCAPETKENADESTLNPYEQALRDNENHKKRFVDELK